MSFIEQRARDVSRPALERVGNVLARWNVSPNAVTYLGLVLTIGVAALAGLGEIRWAGLLYVLAALCDAMDVTRWMARWPASAARAAALAPFSIRPLTALRNLSSFWASASTMRSSAEWPRSPCFWSSLSAR